MGKIEVQATPWLPTSVSNDIKVHSDKNEHTLKNQPNDVLKKSEKRFI